MKARPILLEDFVPYDTSALWRLHDAYYAERGMAAWSGKGGIPFAATSNSGIARQHAHLLLALGRGVAPRGKVTILEVGSGQGAFARNFLDALESGCGAEGRALLARLRFLFSDYSRRNLEEALQQEGLARRVRDGVLVPALFDMRRPDELRDLEGKPVRGQLAAVFASYICCVAPTKVLRKLDGRLLEKYTRLTVDVETAAQGKAFVKALANGSLSLELAEKIQVTHEWRPIELEERVDRELVEAVAGPLPVATFNYPRVFLDMLRGLRGRLASEGIILVSDFGPPDASDVANLNERLPAHYGITFSHDVYFPIFDALAAREGMSIARTTDALLDVHTVVLANGRSPSLEKVFEKTHVRRRDGQDLMDLSGAAAALFDAGRHQESARLFDRCIRIAPRSPKVLFKYGQACIAAGIVNRRTLERLRSRLLRGRRVDEGGLYDWDELLAGVHMQLGAPRKALRCLERSLRREETEAKLDLKKYLLEVTEAPGTRA